GRVLRTRTPQALASRGPRAPPRPRLHPDPAQAGPPPVHQVSRNTVGRTAPGPVSGPVFGPALGLFTAHRESPPPAAHPPPPPVDAPRLPGHGPARTPARRPRRLVARPGSPARRTSARPR